MREGADDGCLLLLSDASAFPRVQCVSPPEENPRAPRIQREGRCRVLVAPHVVVSVVVDRVSRRKRFAADEVGQKIEGNK